MKVEELKKIMKECLREVLKEEGITSNNSFNKMPNPINNFNPNNYIKEGYSKAPTPIKSTGNVFHDLMRETMENSNDLSNYA